MARLIYFLCILLLSGCQADISSKDQVVKGNSDLKTSDEVLDLYQFSHEQQKVEREQAAKRREELKAGRVVLEATQKEKIKRQSLNLAVFARSVSNKLGEKIHYRNFISSGAGSGCEKFPNNNSAQIFFLENGGPKNDFYNMDVDGDGFACKWDPAIYRKIEPINKDNEPKN